MKHQTRQSVFSFFSDYLLAIVLYILLNVLVFHSGLYRYLVQPESYAGNIYIRLELLEKLEKQSQQKVIALVGDSTTEHGIGAAELSEALGHPVANLAMPGTGPLEWLHALRSIDPDGNRFHSIVLLIPPHNMRSFPNEDGIQTLIPVASVSQMFSYAGTNRGSWHNYLDLYYTAFDRLYGFRRDLRDLITNPSRLRNQNETRDAAYRDIENWAGQSTNVCKTQADFETGRIVNWGGMRPDIRKLSANAVRRISQLNARPTVSGIVDPLKELTQYYSNSTTNIVVISIPFGLGHKVRRNSAPMRQYFSTVEAITKQPNVAQWDASRHPLFDDCTNFYDFRHLNTRGRRLFTREIASYLSNNRAGS